MSVLPVELPPHNIDAEQAVLGAALISAKAVEQLMAMLEREDFYVPEHRVIFPVIAELFRTESPVDTLTVCEALRAAGNLDAAGGVAYILTLAESVPHSAHVEYYAELVQEASTKRSLLLAAADITEIAHDPAQNEQDTLSLCERVFTAATERRRTQQAFDAYTVMASTAALYGPTALQPPKCFPTGMASLDEMLGGGFAPGTTVWIGGHASAGKTTLAQNVFLHLGRKGFPAAFFSLEMQIEPLGARLQGCESYHVNPDTDVTLKRLLAHANPELPGRIPEHAESDLYTATSRIAGYPLHVIHATGYDVGQIQAETARLQRLHDIQVIFVDYLQLMRGHEDRNKAMDAIGKELQRLAQKRKVCVVGLSQLNRNEKLITPPTLQSLRDSGALEGSGDTIMFVWRKKHALRSTEPDDGLGPVEIIVAKQKQGATGPVIVQGDLNRCVFWEQSFKHGDDDAPPPTQFY